MRKLNGKGKNKFPRKAPTIGRVIPLTKADLERGMKIGAKVEREKNPTMLIYYRD
ncbi:MAG: hypothetical protein ACRESZ_03425 [Methylococcales bacterium]